MLKLDSDFTRIWQELSGHYACPRHPQTTERLGPLVGYAARYQEDGEEKQFVGDGYYNFAVIESDPNPDVLDHFASHLAHQITEEFGSRTVQTVLMMTMGGIMLGTDLGRHLCCQRVFPDKKTTALATQGSREQSKLLLARHYIAPGNKVVIVEDVCHNFSTTDEACGIVKEKGATVIGIACAMNRSPDETFESKDFGTLPVISLIFRPTPEYRQDDPEVADDIAEGKVVWKPKEEWERLRNAMANAAERFSGAPTGG